MHIDAAKDNETFVVSNGIGIRIEMRAVEAARIGNEFYLTIFAKEFSAAFWRTLILIEAYQ